MKKNHLIFLSSGALLVLLLPFSPFPTGTTTGWTTFLGRFHLLFVHFPVVLVLSLLCLEGWKWFRPAVGWSGLLPFVWIAALFSCYLTVCAGYLLYLTGEYQGNLVRNHLWGGVLLTATLSAAAIFRFPNRPGTRSWLYNPILLGITAVLVFYTSHLGGSLTHGPGFLKEYLPSFRKDKPAPVEQKKQEELLVFQDLIVPVFENRCISCHNKYKTKGGLLLTSFSELSKGGKSGKPTIVEGAPKNSDLYHRITLAPDDDDHMPPSEKPALTDDEIALIHWWIAEGASPEQVLGEGPSSPEGKALINRYLPQLFQAERLKVKQQNETAALARELAKLGKKLELIIEPDGHSQEGYFAVSMPIPPSIINDQTISKLLPYAEVISKISLPGAEITDDGLYDLGRMPHLRQLYLPKTCIKGQGLAYLQPLTELRALNLSYSWLTNEGALNLLKLPQLELIYVFGTETDANILEAIRRHLPETKILEEEGAYY